MKRFILSKCLFGAVTILSVMVLNFVVLHLMPGDPVSGLLGDYPAPPEYIERLRSEFGLDKSIPEQLLSYVSQVMTGNLGYSFANRAPVLDLLLSRSANTLILVIPALIISSILAVLFSLIAAPRAGGLVDACLTTIVLFGYSVPVFWLAQILIIVFALWLGWLPAQGMVSHRGAHAGTFYDVLRHYILPLTAVVVFYLALIGRVARAKMIECLNEDYVTTALAKGLPFRKVLSRHVLPNSLIPIITVIGYSFSYSLTGAILVEAAFGWPGLGTLFLTSVATRDYPVLLGILLASCILVVVTNVLTDLVYSVVDPRISAAGAQRDA